MQLSDVLAEREAQSALKGELDKLDQIREERYLEMDKHNYRKMLERELREKMEAEDKMKVSCNFDKAYPMHFLLFTNCLGYCYFVETLFAFGFAADDGDAEGAAACGEEEAVSRDRGRDPGGRDAAREGGRLSKVRS